MKQAIADRDQLKALAWHLPAVAASAGQLDLAARAAGFPLPDAYRGFLAHADGWRGFYVSTDLFGTAVIIDGRARAVLAQPELAAFVEALGLSRNAVLAIGGSDVDRYIFIVVSPASPTLPGGVIWWAGEEIDRFEDFTSFFDAMSPTING